MAGRGATYWERSDRCERSRSRYVSQSLVGMWTFGRCCSVWCVQISDALEYVESRKVVHRDIAARNVLVAGDGATAKLSDFGMSRFLTADYYRLVDGINPLRARPLCSNTVIGALAVDEWAVTFGIARRGLGGLRSRPGPSSLVFRSRSKLSFIRPQIFIIRCDESCWW